MDGRNQRAARNHDQIVDAIYELVRAGNVEPTVEEVAAKAGVGVRTVFRQFHDLDTLTRRLGERVFAEIFALVDPRPPTGRMLEDLEAVIEQRARIFEHLMPFRRAARVVRHRLVFIQEQDALMARMLRGGIQAVVGDRLARDRLEALDLALSFEAWDRLRDQQKLGPRRAAQVMLAAAAALVA